LERGTSQITAIVRGQYDYEVVLAVKRGALDHSCDCPMGEEGDFCKHCVAASLAFLHDRAPAAKQRGPSLADATAVLVKEPPAKLAKLLAEWAQDDKLLHQRLLQFAASRGGPEKQFAAALAAFEKAAKPRRYLRYGEASGYASDVDEAIDVFEELSQGPHGAGVIDLCEKALEVLAEGAEMVHDDGEITDLRDRLLEIHYSTCSKFTSDPIALAQRLFRLEMDDDWDAFYRTASRYKEPLGPAGLIAFRILVEKSTGPRKMAMLEDIAQASGDVDALVAILARDLATPYRYRQIISAFVKAARLEDALQWAQRGLRAFPADTGLLFDVADGHHARGEHAEAMKLIWPIYTNSPSIQSYEILKKHASLAGEWAEWRDNAIGLVRQRIAVAKGHFDHSMLVAIFLHEGNTAEAWAEAQKGNCESHLWFELAKAREKEHPGDAAPIYLQRAAEEIAQVRNSDYASPVALLIRTAAVMGKIGAAAEFRRQLDSFRLRFKAKRNFIKLLDRHRAALDPEPGSPPKRK
jgi:tetratricopeptide (TPR) repeat protein